MYKELFSNITFGTMQEHGAVSALPIFSSKHSNAQSYLTLPEAMEQMLIKIEEVSESGSVPELKVISTATIPVLIIAGEEVHGAKQNRILNTSILIPAKGELIIPVSCTERGRWSYSSPDFKDSGNISSKEIRQTMGMSVNFSLSAERSFRSDQGMVWDKIEELHRKSGSNGTSRTRAMNDAYQTRSDQLNNALHSFPLIQGQTGILFFHAGKAAGLDILSQPAAFARLHEKLVKSYLIDFIAEKGRKQSPDALQNEARRFQGDALSGEVKVYKSPGLGEDHRLQSREVHGSALIHEKELIHACLFSVKTEEQRMAGLGRRREIL